MSTATRYGGGIPLTPRRETCDKCGSSMLLLGAAYQFERWECSRCHQVVGIDCDPVVGGRFQLHRGYPWRYAPGAFDR